VSAVMGDELLMRAHSHTLDFADRGQVMGFLVGHVTRANAPIARPFALARAVLLGGRIARAPRDACEAAIMLGRRFGYDEATAADLGHVLEYWDGGGFPGGAQGEEIPVPVRVIQVATLVVAAYQDAGAAGAVELVRRRRGHSLGPAEADIFLN